MGSESDCESILADLPTGIVETYSRILCRIRQENPTNQNYIKKALQWVLLSAETLTLEAICEVITIRDHDDCRTLPRPVMGNKLLRWCSSFLRYSDSDHTVEIAHYTVQEYFERLGDQDFGLGNSSEVDLGRVCLRYLLLQDYRVDARTTSKNRKEWLDKRPFRTYAIENWISHVADENRTFLHPDLLSLAEKLFMSVAQFQSFALESYDFSHDAHKMEDTKVLEATPLHWASALWLWQLVERLSLQDPSSVSLITSFGAPLHCAVDSGPKSLNGYLSSPAAGTFITETLRVLILHGAEVSQTYDRDGRSIMRAALSQLPRTSSEILLREGLICDRTTLQELYQKCAIETATAGEVSVKPVDLVTAQELSNQSIFARIDRENMVNDDVDEWLRLKKLLDGRGTFQSDVLTSSTTDEQRLLYLAMSNQKTEAMSLATGSNVEGSAIDSDGSRALHHSVRIGHTELVEVLADRGSGWKSCNEYRQMPLHWAALFGAVESYKILVKYGGADSADWRGHTPLHLAAFAGNLDLIKVIVADETDSGCMGAVNQDGLTPLLATAAVGHFQCVDYLLRYSSETSKRRTSKRGLSALHLACQSGSASTVNILLKCGFNPNDQSDDGSAALHIAVTHLKHGCLDLIKLLLSAKADPAVPRLDANYPVHLLFSDLPNEGVGKAMKEILREPGELVELTRNLVTSRNKLGETPLHRICRYATLKRRGCRAWISLLLKQGSDPLTEDYQGESSLSIVLRSFMPKQNGTPSLEYFDPHAASILSQILNHIQPLSPDTLSPSIQWLVYEVLLVFASSHRWGGVDQLIDLVDDVSVIDPVSRTSPLLLAIKSKCGIETLSKMVGKASNLSRYDNGGWAPLHHAAMGGHQMIVQTLLDNGADINQLSANNRRYTPLLSTSLFSENGRSIAQVLIDHGADVNVRSGQGRSFFHDACRYGCLSILESVSLEEIKSAGRVSAAQNGPNFSGWENIGCFHWAALGDQQNVGSFLLANGLATVDEASNGEQMTALHIAAYHGSTAFVDFLLEAGASLNPKNSAGKTPFYMALCRHQTDVMRQLIHKGARVFDENTKTIELEVAGWGNLEAMSVLQQADRGAHILHERETSSLSNLSFSKNMVIEADCKESGSVPLCSTRRAPQKRHLCRRHVYNGSQVRN